jgi:hypothetical protein
VRLPGGVTWIRFVAFGNKALTYGRAMMSRFVKHVRAGISKSSNTFIKMASI